MTSGGRGAWGVELRDFKDTLPFHSHKPSCFTSPQETFTLQKHSAPILPWVSPPLIKIPTCGLQKASLSLALSMPFSFKRRACITHFLGMQTLSKLHFLYVWVAHYSPWHRECITLDTSCPWTAPTSIKFPRADSIEIISLWLLSSLRIRYLTSSTSSWTTARENFSISSRAWTSCFNLQSEPFLKNGTRK